ncbi:EamA family transporter [Pollutimonas nitritireducens]|uniref:EamA family transporter n=1 Tax=Pollutimonas nitritireducens TaxID=2045209 RepID=A0A2N4UG95_9BURK|nr:EamA family transporter [Pollutimonas nitritireducens]PLC54036.1 EamA family transporter [Pollutimonas nitritireducens]
MKENQADRGALFLMGITVVLWGFSWIVMKHLSALIGPFDLVVGRYGLAFLVLFSILVATRKSLRFPPFWLTVGIAVFQTTAFQCLCQMALTSGGAGHVALLAYTMPFWVVVFAWLLLKERPARRHILALVLAALGLIAVIAPWKGVGSVQGSLLALGGGMSWALGVVLTKKMFISHRVEVLNLSSWQMLLGALFALPVALVWPQRSIVWGPDLFWGMAYMAILASALGWWLWLSVVRKVSATIAGMSSLGVPVLTIILAWLLLGERPTLLEAWGVMFIMAGLVAINLPPEALRRLRRRNLRT